MIVSFNVSIQNVLPFPSTLLVASLISSFHPTPFPSSSTQFLIFPAYIFLPPTSNLQTVSLKLKFLKIITLAKHYFISSVTFNNSNKLKITIKFSIDFI